MTKRAIIRETYDAQRAAEAAADLYDSLETDVYYSLPIGERDRVYDHPDVVRAREARDTARARARELQAEAGGVVYRIADEKLDGLAEHITRLNRRAEKIGVETITLTITAEREDVTRKRDGREYAESFTFVTLDGGAPMVEGYAFIAMIDHDDAGDDGRVPVLPVPAFGFLHSERRLGREHGTEEDAEEWLEGIDLTPYRHAENRCDHCGYLRDRKRTYVVADVESRETLQVGSTCLRDFTGANNPHAAARWAEILADLDEELRDESEGYGAGHVRRVIRVSDYLTVAVALIESDGYTPRSGGVGTADFAMRWLLDGESVDGGLEIRDRRGNVDRLEISDSTVEEAEAVLAWLREDLAEREEISDFDHNLVTYGTREYLGERGHGFVAYAPVRYRRHLGAEVKREEQAKLAETSEYVGNVGDRLTLTATVTRVYPYEGNYGAVFITNLVTPDGNALLWWASRELEVGKTYSMAATVKRHEIDRYTEAKTTTINRPAKITEVEESEATAERETVKTAEEREEEALARREREERRAKALAEEGRRIEEERIRKLEEERRAAAAESHAAGEAAGLRCLDHGDECAGPVEMRMALSGTGIPYPRCEAHFGERLDEQERITRLYGGAAPPAGFDPCYAGERWDESD